MLTEKAVTLSDELALVGIVTAIVVGIVTWLITWLAMSV